VVRASMFSVGADFVTKPRPRTSPRVTCRSTGHDKNVLPETMRTILGSHPTYPDRTVPYLTRPNEATPTATGATVMP